MPHAAKVHRAHPPAPQAPRPSATARGYDARWRAFRAWFLRHHPLCVACAKDGKVVPAQHVDHVQPVEGPDDPLFYAEGNHQSLCVAHHAAKTAREDGGYGNPRG
jgi:5-methylcytosine-specific restriction protein A